MKDFDFIALVLPIVKNLVFAIITFVVGLTVIKWFSRFLEKQVKNSRLDETLKTFIVSFVITTAKILLIISVVRILGIDTTSFVAIIGAAGLAVGLAFQGTLSNFAGGVLLLALKPFKVGDYIEASGFSGTVEAIQVLYTHIITPDNKVILIPNGVISNASIVNYSIKDKRRLDLEITVGKETDIELVENIICQEITKHKSVLKNPKPLIRLTKYANNSNVFTMRIWVNSSDYWDVRFDLIEAIKKGFDDEEGVNIISVDAGSMK